MTTTEFFSYLKSFRNLEPRYEIVEHDGTDMFPDGRHATTGVRVKKGTQLLQVEGFATIRLPLSSTSMVTIPTYNRRQREVPPEVASAIGNDVACCLFGDLYLRKYGSVPILVNRTQSHFGARAERQTRATAFSGPPTNAKKPNLTPCAGSEDVQAPPVERWKWCVENYLKVTWFPFDEAPVRAFSTSNVTRELLHHLCVEYSVARTIPGNGLAKYQRFADMLNRHRDTVMTRANTASVIEEELANMRNAYGANFLSAITKAFWMMKQHPVVIYDSYGWNGLQRLHLRPGYSGYHTYYDAWFRFFESPETQQGLDEALSWLPESPYMQGLLAARKIDGSQIKSIAETQWLRNRVADRYLTTIGGVEFN